MKRVISLMTAVCIMFSMLVAFSVTASADSGTGFVYANGTHFYCDGKYFYIAGCNSYNLHRYGDGSNTASVEDICSKFMDQSLIDQCMQEMADAGVNVVRTWAFSSDNWHGFESYDKDNGKWIYNEAEFMELDYIMYSAKKHGIKVILTLENYWEGLGGIDAKLSALGLASNSHAARTKYFSNAQCKAWYKAYASHLVNRVNYFTKTAYKDDPTVFAWDLMNEPRFQDGGEDSSSKTLRAWVDEMGAYVKSLDSNHMVCVGIEGHGNKYGFGGNEGNDFIYIQQSPYIDFCSAHPYPDENWAQLSTAQTKTLIKKWISDAHNVVGKPMVIGEFNVSKSNSQAVAYWKAVFDSLYEEDAAGGLFWDYYTSSQSEFTVMKGMAVLSYFKQHSIAMLSKNVDVDMTSVTPSVISVDRAEGVSDKTVTLNYYGTDSLTAIKCGAATLTKGTDYTVSGNVVTIKASYIKKLDDGTTTLQFIVGDKNPNVNINITDSSKSEDSVDYWCMKFECETDFSYTGSKPDTHTFGAGTCIRAQGCTGTLSANFPEAQNYTFTMRAGSMYYAIKNDLYIDGTKVGTFNVSQTGASLADFDITVPVSAGQHEIKVVFANEFNSGNDYLLVTCPELDYLVNDDSDTDTDSSIDTDTDSGSDVDTNTDTDTQDDTNTDTQSDTDSDINTDTDSQSDTDTNSDTDTDTDNDTNTDVEGDINGDGVLDIVDVVLARAYIVGNNILDESGIAKGDINDDGTLDIVDVVIMRSIIVNG